MGTKPRKPASSKQQNARIVSFDDAKRTSARKPANAPACAQANAPARTSAALPARKPSGKPLEGAPTRPLAANGASAPKAAGASGPVTPSASGPTSRKSVKAAKAAKPKKAAKPAKSAKKASAIPFRKRSSRKEFNIARGEEREGALEMRSEEDIEAQARSDEESRKQAKRKNSRVLAFSEELRKRSEKKKRARSKAKAAKKFDAAYGGEGVSASASSAQSAQAQGDSGPRAAVYEGKMGSSHKKSSKLQAKGAGVAIKSMASGVSLPKAKFSGMPKGLRRALLSVGLVALFAVTLYGPAQQYYQQMRETDRLQAEYAAVASRSNTLQSTIDTLSSEEGIEDKAHTDLGYVKKGEQTATVKGANIVEDAEFSSNVAPGSIPAPETWYSPVLDVLFGYSS